MNFKQFLKPDLRKIILWILFCVIFLLIIPSLYIHLKYFQETPYSVEFRAFKGFPLIYYSPGSGGCIPGDSGMVCVNMPSSFNVGYLVIDVIFWYLLFCLIIWIYDKVKRK